ARVRIPAQLSLALPRARPPGILATLAHLAVDVVARLSLHPARRLEAGRPAHVRRAAADHAARRPLAWRRLDLRDLGCLSRVLADLRALARATAAAAPRSVALAGVLRADPARLAVLSRAVLGRDAGDARRALALAACDPGAAGDRRSVHGLCCDRARARRARPSTPLDRAPPAGDHGARRSAAAAMFPAAAG